MQEAGCVVLKKERLQHRCRVERVGGHRDLVRDGCDFVLLRGVFHDLVYEARAVRTEDPRNTGNECLPLGGREHARFAGAF